MIDFRLKFFKVQYKLLMQSRIDLTPFWENGYIENFNGKLRDELLNGEIYESKTCKIILFGKN